MISSTIKSFYNQKITVLNKLRSADSISKQDLWYKTVLNYAKFYETSQSSVSGTTISIGTKIRVLIADADNAYLPYKQWAELGNQDEHFTISNGDYIVLGEVKEEITSSTITKIISQYEPKACTVRYFRELNKSVINMVDLYIEGV